MQKKINKISIQLFNKLLFTLSILSILSTAHCNQPAQKQDMAHPPSNDNNHMQTAEETTFINNKHLALLDIVERMSVYLEEEKQKPLPDLGCGPAYQKAWIERVEASISNREQFVNELHQNTLHLLNNKMDINRYLYHLLNKRFNYLDNRAKSIKSYLTAGQTGSVIPTNKDLFEFLAQDKVIAREKDFNEQVRIGAVTKFELLNLLIRESYKQCTLNELSPHTIKFLRASVQLHPILTGERRDLGHPDEAGGPYAILEPLVVADSTVVKENYPTLFVGAAIVKKLTEEINKKHVNHSETAHAVYLGMLYRILKEQAELKKNIFFQLNRAKINQELLSIEKNLDLNIYQAYCTNEKKQELYKWPFELPHPSFLIQTLDKTDFLSLPPTNKKKKKASFKKNIAPVQLTESQHEEPKTISTIINQEIATQDTAMEANKPEPVVQPTEPVIKKGKEEDNDEKEEEEIVETDPISVHASYKQRKQVKIAPAEQKEKIEINPMTCSFSFERWLPPRGLRAFHAKMLNSPYPPIRLRDNKKQDIVDQLFNSQQQCNITYKEFKSVWEYIGGEIHKSGGSHQELFGPRKDSVFSTFYSKNYGKNTISYWKAAFLYVGFRPTQWMK